MAEHISGPPPDELPELPHPNDSLPDSPFNKQGFSGFIEGLRLNRIQQHEFFDGAKEDDDDEEEEESPRAARTGGLLRRVFSAIVGREPVAPNRAPAETPEQPPEQPPDVAHFRAPPAEAEQPAAPDLSSAIEGLAYEDVEPEAVPESEPEAGQKPAAASTEVIMDEAPEVAAATVETPLAETLPPTQEVVEVYETQRGIPPETALLFGAYEHHRATKFHRQTEALHEEVTSLKREVSGVERENKKLKKELQTQVETPKVSKTPEVHEAPRRPTPERRVPQERIVPKTPEQRRTVASETTQEQQRQAVEKVVERQNKAYSAEQKKEVIERILAAPEFKGALNTEVQKDISYELSHEHKDMDAQSQSAWAALQAAAEATAKANASAFAHAGGLIPVAEEGTALKEAEAQRALEQKLLYKKAAVSGFVTAVVIIAILLIILVLKSR